MRLWWASTSTRWTVSLKVFIFSGKSDAKHLFTALSVQGKTKASLLSFHLYIFYAETSFLKIINEESTQLYRAIHSLGSYRVQRWRWNMNSYEWTWFEFQKASQSRKLFEGRLERFLTGYNSLVFCVRVLKKPAFMSYAWFRGMQFSVWGKGRVSEFVATHMSISVTCLLRVNKHELRQWSFYTSSPQLSWTLTLSFIFSLDGQPIFV